MTAYERKPRMRNPVIVVPEAMQALQALSRSAETTGVPPLTIALITLRASQINGCSVCVDMHTKMLRKEGESEDRIAAVAAWQDMPYFNPAERAAFALAEAVTRLSDRPDPVPDEIWNEAARHYDEAGLAGLLLAITGINAWNRLNVSTRQLAGQWRPESGEWKTSPASPVAARGAR
jgi:AhpD family alkylhydroperoxidase